MSSVSPAFVSRLQYDFNRMTSSVRVLSDEKTILGASYTQTNMIVKENIADSSTPIVNYTGNTSRIWTLAVGELNNVIFVAEFDSRRLVQYDLETTRVVRSYGRIGIGGLSSMITYSNLVFIGGWGSFHLTVLDAATRKLVHRPFVSSVRNSSALILCRANSGIGSERVILIVTGTYISPDKSRAVLFDVSELIGRYAIGPVHKYNAIIAKRTYAVF